MQHSIDHGIPRAGDAPPIRVVLADDHAVVREGLRSLINAQADMQVVGEAADGEAACRLVGSLAPDVLVTDLSMPVLGGAAATASVRAQSPGTRVLALSLHEERSYVTSLLKAGATGYALKRAAPEELVRAIRTVAAGEAYLDPSLTGGLVAEYLEALQPAAAPEDDGLSERERDVLVRIARGYSNKEIAAVIGVSVKTVESYKARMADKLSLRSRVDIVRYASSRGWLDEQRAAPR